MARAIRLIRHRWRCRIWGRIIRRTLSLGFITIIWPATITLVDAHRADDHVHSGRRRSTLSRWGRAVRTLPSHLRVSLYLFEPNEARVPQVHLDSKMLHRQLIKRRPNGDLLESLVVVTNALVDVVSVKNYLYIRQCDIFFTR